MSESVRLTLQHLNFCMEAFGDPIPSGKSPHPPRSTRHHCLRSTDTPKASRRRDEVKLRIREEGFVQTVERVPEQEKRRVDQDLKFVNRAVRVPERCLSTWKDCSIFQGTPKRRTNRPEIAGWWTSQPLWTNLFRECPGPQFGDRRARTAAVRRCWLIVQMPASGTGSDVAQARLPGQISVSRRFC